MAVVFIDLDGLKPLNDAYGHEAGDAAIFATAVPATQATDTCDVVGRLGGDEFLVVLCHEHSCDGDAVVARIHESVSNCRVPVGDAMVPLEASLGVALAHCDPTDPMMLVRQADEAMYEAKINRTGEPGSKHLFRGLRPPRRLGTGIMPGFDRVDPSRKILSVVAQPLSASEASAPRRVTSDPGSYRETRQTLSLAIDRDRHIANDQKSTHVGSWVSNLPPFRTPQPRRLNRV